MVWHTESPSVHPSIYSNELKALLSKYEQVHEVKDLFWESPSPFAGIKNDNRAATMVVDMHIPSYLAINGEKIKIAYKGQTATFAF